MIGRRDREKRSERKGRGCIDESATRAIAAALWRPAFFAGRAEPRRMPPAKAGMIAFLVTEASFFGTLVMSYVYFLSQTFEGTPKPSQVFRLPVGAGRIGLSFLEQRDDRSGGKSSGSRSPRRFLRWWGLTIVLGALFLAGHDVGVERPDRQVGLDHQPQSVRDHVISHWLVSTRCTCRSA